MTPRPATVIEAPRLSRRLAAEVTLVSETFQYTGSFKFRAALNVVCKAPHPKILAASSGNFGQALAFACSLVGKTCIIVMPRTSAQVKIDAVRQYGGEVDLIDTDRISRAERIRQLATEHPDAYVASPFDDPLVIQGNATLGAEILALGRDFDAVLAPIGGGGLTSGLITGLQGKIPVVAAEPSLANDAARSLREGRIVANPCEPLTIADGARTLSVGRHPWTILKHGLAGIVEVPEENIREGVRLLFELANLKAEPTGALPVGAVLTEPDRFRGRRVCCVVSGGNVDPETYYNILAQRPAGR